MNPQRLSFGLGVFSIALGAAEVLGSRRIARALGNDHRIGLITLRAFGAREMIAGAGLIAAPAHSTRVWYRVAGDLMDLTALGFAARRANGRPALWGAVAFVAGAAALDALVARALDRQAGKASPLVMGPASPVSVRAGRHATTIEPDSKRLVRAPDVPSQTP